MKNRFLLIFLITCLLLSACTAPKSDSTNDSKTPVDSVTQNQGDPDDLKYKDITCRVTNDFVSTAIALQNSNYSFELNIPGDWELKRVSGGMISITRENTEIGSIARGTAEDAALWKIVDEQSMQISNMTVSRYIERSTTEGELLFRYRFCYSYTENDAQNTMSLTVKYEEADVGTADKLLGGCLINDTSAVTKFGYLSELGDASLLILGNSFVNSSNIGNILREMFSLNQKSCSVEAVSRGYATVNTYVNDSSLMSKIRNGDYDAVFICGFYSSDEIDNAVTLSKACQKSGTKLIIFPAHNENDKTPILAQKQCEGSYILHWMREINSLIKAGRDKWDFCINDAHLHSTPLAGYVGAHMIYRAIYGEVPQGDMTSSISYKEIKNVLGDYVKTANPDSSIMYLE